MSARPSDPLAATRARLAGVGGSRYWRALEELADEPGFRQQMLAAIPQLATLAPMDRRGFLRFLGASLALAGLTACSGPPPEQIVPQRRIPDGGQPDDPVFYASTLAMAGGVAGVLVETHGGRPTKIEGNPLHPASGGATGPWLQAAVLELWDPDRSQSPWNGKQISTWDAVNGVFAGLRQRLGADGRGLCIVSAPIQSPTLAGQRAALLARWPAARWHIHAAVDDDAARVGSRLAFGRELEPTYDLAAADVIVSLEADLLDATPGHLRHARGWAARRKPDATMNRLYAVEATPSLTGAAADHAWPLASSKIALFALELARALGLPGLPAAPASGIAATRIRGVANDLRNSAGRSLVAVGRSQPAEVHALAHLINAHLGNLGRTVQLHVPLAPRSDDDGLPALAKAIRGGAVDALLLLDTNLAYDAPADLDMAALLRRVPLSIHHGAYRDETALLAHWHLPAAHALEAWSDARTPDGVASVVQPVIAPLYDSRSVHELLGMLTGAVDATGLAQVRATWSAQGVDDDAWTRALHDGVLPSLAATRTATASAAWLERWHPLVPTDDGLEVVFRPDPSVWDGRHANNGWLQELPRPSTQLTWDNAALLSPSLAKRLGVVDGDVIALRVGDRAIDVPVWRVPGQAPHTITLHLGQGRRAAGRVGSGVGFDAYRLRRQAHPWTDTAAAQATGAHRELAATQTHFAMQDRAPVRAGTLQQFHADPAFIHHGEEPTPPSFYPEQPGGEYAWAMQVDLNACIGCKGCTVACQAENNIPVVGAEEVRRGHEMHWIRVDRYYEGEADAPRTYHQPVPCMHCEHAPCEVVCPVGATVHDSEGLNVQVYNRCVGTRFCSNNCPYKVRRFNFLQYSDLSTESLKAQRNPDVTVRNRGVMEKCTYCIQRIETAHIAADREGRPIADGEVVTACQAACPTQAISFGNGRDPASAVAKAKASPLDYHLLAELNTRPRTSYGARLRNPHPDSGDDA